MIRAVLDTNVLASGVLGLSRGVSTPTRLLHAWRAAQFELVVSDYIIEELRRTLGRPYFSSRISPEEQALFLSLLVRVAERVVIRRRVSGIATHPEDDPILATALSGRVDFLVTGDRPLRERVPSFQSIRLVSPAEFLDVLSREV